MNLYPKMTDQALLEVLMLSPKAVAIYSSNDIVIQMANDAMIAFWGKDRNVIGRPLDEAVPELKGQPFIGMLQQVLKTGITQSGLAIPAELLINGHLQTFYYDYEYKAISDENGPYCIIHTATDVTEVVLGRKAVELAKVHEIQLYRQQLVNEQLAAANEELNTVNDELHDAQESLLGLNNELEARVGQRTKELAESEASVRFMLNEAPIAIAIFKGRNLIVDTANEMALTAWGKNKDIIGLPLHVAVPELQGQMFLQTLDEVFASGEPFHGHEVKALLEQDGRIEDVYSNFVYHPFKSEHGETTHIMLIAQVVTEQVNSRKKAEHAEEMFRISIEAAKAGTWFMDATTREFNASPRFKELFGFASDDKVTYEEVTERIPENYRDKVKTAVELVMTNGETYTVEHPIALANNQEIWVSALGRLYRNDEGKPMHFSGLMLDVTQQKKDEIRKNDFIGMVSHELKTPLTSLSGYIQVLHRNAKKTADGPTAEILNKAHNQLKKMTSMINGFLNISRLESGKIQLQKNVFDLDALVHDMIDEIGVSSASYKITMNACPGLMVDADRDKIGSVISNLLSNAIKYSPKREQIIVHCTRVGDMAQVSIQDEGLGIDATDVPKLFQRFYRIENKDNPHISGFGIGLYLSAEIVQHHGGKIWVESEKGVGSTFYFSIPMNTEVQN